MTKPFCHLGCHMTIKQISTKITTHKSEINTVRKYVNLYTNRTTNSTGLSREEALFTHAVGMATKNESTKIRPTTGRIVYCDSE